MVPVECEADRFGIGSAAGHPAQVGVFPHLLLFVEGAEGQLTPSPGLLSKRQIKGAFNADSDQQRRSSAFKAVTAAPGRILKENPDLLILDLMLTGKDGLSVCSGFAPTIPARS